MYLDAESFQFLELPNNKSRRLWVIFFKYFICVFFAGAISFTIISIVMCMITVGHFDVDHLYHPDKTS